MDAFSNDLQSLPITYKLRNKINPSIISMKFKFSVFIASEKVNRVSSGVYSFYREFLKMIIFKEIVFISYYTLPNESILEALLTCFLILQYS